MDHHTSWFSFFPGYQDLQHWLQVHFGGTVIIPQGGNIETAHHIYAAGLVFILLTIMALIAKVRLRNIEDHIVPSTKFGVVTFLEIFMEAVLGVMKDVIGKDYKKHVPLIGSLALFIFFSNFLGLVPGFVPPTDNLNTTFACALVVFLWFNYCGLKAHGMGHITHLLNPLGTKEGWFFFWFFGPVEILGLLVRPVTLAVRLACNMIGDHAILFAFAGIFPLLLPLPFYALGTLVCILQTMVFCILSCIYIALHTAEAEH